MREKANVNKGSELEAFQYERSLMFFPGQILEHNRSEGRDSYRFLSAEAVQAAFSSLPVDSGYLPEGIIRCGSTKRGNFVAQVIKSQLTRIHIEPKHGATIKTVQIHLPALLFFGYSKMWRIHALKTDSPTPDTEIFKAPFPNVSDYGICWGGKNTVPDTSVKTIGEAWQLFLDAPFTSSSTANKSKRFNSDVRQLLFHLAKTKEKFPLDDLVELKLHPKQTIRSMINSYLGDETE